MTRRAIVAALLVVLCLPAAATAALRIRGVDATGYPRVSVTVVTTKPVGRPPAILENGRKVPVVDAVNFARAKSIVLALDRSQSMRGRPLAEAVAAAKAFVDAKPAGDEVAVSTFASGKPTLSSFSADTVDADSALGAIAVDTTPGTRLYDALVISARGLGSRALHGHVIVIVTDGNETSSHARLADVVAEAKKDHVSIYVIGIESRSFTPAPLRKMAADTGGRFYAASSVALLRQIYAAIADELERTWQIGYLTPSRPGDTVHVSAAVPAEGSAETTALISAEQARPSRSSLPKAAFTTTGLMALALVVGLLVLAAVALVLRKSSSEELRRRIAPHIDAEPVKKKPKSPRTNALRTLFRMTENVLGRSRQWIALGKLLERGDVPLKTAEFVYVIIVGGIMGGFLVAATGRKGIFLLIGFAVGAALPLGFAWRKAQKRVAAFDEQLPDLLMSVAASLKAGHSFKQAIQTLVEDAEDPARKEFQRVLAETSLGRSIEDALADMANRLQSRNFSFIVTAVTIQNQVGGSLAGLFDMVADTVRQRQLFSRKIRALTSMGRASAYVLLGLPFFLAAVLAAVNHAYMAPLFTTSAGHTMIIGSLVSMSIGAVILRKIVNFKG
jgi:tight adherence protein B